MLSEPKFMDILEQSKPYLSSMHISVDARYLWDNFMELENRWEDEIEKNVKHVKTLMLGEFVPNKMNYIYYDLNICAELATHEILVLDLLPFCVKYHTRGKAYQNLLKICEPYYSNKIQFLLEKKILVQDYFLFAPYIGQYKQILPIQSTIALFKNKYISTWKDLENNYTPYQDRMKTRIKKFIAFKK